MTFADVAAPKRAIFSDLQSSKDASRARWLLKEPFFDVSVQVRLLQDLVVGPFK